MTQAGLFGESKAACLVFSAFRRHCAGMYVLALDTAMAACSAALLDDASDLCLASETMAMARGHAEAIAPMIARIFAQAHLSPQAVGRIVVTQGPGSFTGVRVGLAAAEGLACATGAEIIGVCTLEALAISAPEGGRTLAAIDARHDHVYCALYDQGHCLVAPHYASVAEAQALADGDTFLVGDAAALEGHEARLRVPDPVALARHGSKLPVGGGPVRPLYLKGVAARTKAERSHG